jgi:hypothetical protein
VATSKIDKLRFLAVLDIFIKSSGDTSKCLMIKDDEMIRYLLGYTKLLSN